MRKSAPVANGPIVKGDANAGSGAEMLTTGHAARAGSIPAGAPIADHNAVADRTSSTPAFEPHGRPGHQLAGCGPMSAILRRLEKLLPACGCQDAVGQVVERREVVKVVKR